MTKKRKSKDKIIRAHDQLLMKVKKFADASCIPVVMLTFAQGTYSAAGSSLLIDEQFAFNSDVQAKFLQALSKHQEDVPAPGGCVEKSSVNVNIFKGLRKLPNLSVDQMRVLITKGLSEEMRTGKRHLFNGERPIWWPEGIPFASPNHPVSKNLRMKKQDLLRVCESLAKYKGISPAQENDQWSDSEGEMPSPTEENVPDMLKQLPKIGVHGLRTLITKALATAGKDGKKLRFRDPKPVWWPEDLPFASPCHPKPHEKRFNKEQLLRIANKLAEYTESCDSESAGAQDELLNLL